MKIEKLKIKSSKELIVELEQRKVKLYNYKLDLKAAKEKDTGKSKVLKKDVARVLTLLNQKNILDIKQEKEVKEEKKEEDKKEIKKDEK